MSAAALLADMRTRGAVVEIDGAELRIRAPRGTVTPDLADRLRQHKAELVRLLKPRVAWDADDWLGFFDERAGIAEFCGGLPRIAAERMAWESCLTEWLKQNPPGAAVDQCPVCAGSLRGHGAEVKDIPADNGGPARVHRGCADTMGERRRAIAAAALVGFGIGRPAAWKPKRRTNGELDEGLP